MRAKQKLKIKLSLSMPEKRSKFNFKLKKIGTIDKNVILISIINALFISVHEIYICKMKESIFFHFFTHLLMFSISNRLIIFFL